MKGIAMKKITNSFVPSLPYKAIWYFVLAYWIVAIQVRVVHENIT